MGRHRECLVCGHPFAADQRDRDRDHRVNARRQAGEDAEREKRRDRGEGAVREQFERVPRELHYVRYVCELV